MRKTLIIIAIVVLHVSLLYIAIEGNHLPTTAFNKNIALYRYIIMPLLGLLTGFAFFLLSFKGRLHMPDKIKEFSAVHYKKIIIVISVLYFVVFAVMAYLRFESFNTNYFDMGIFGHKIWGISVSNTLPDAIKASLAGHFQPILLMYGLLFKFYPSVHIVVLSQVLFMTLSVIALFSIFKMYIEDRVWLIVLVVIFFLYPQTEFNTISVFHPDFFYLFFCLWAYRFSLRGRHTAALIAITAGALTKETFIIGALFFSFYVAFDKKGRRPAIIFAMVFLVLISAALFYIFVLLPKNLASFMDNFSYIGEALHNPSVLFHSILKFIDRKVFFVIFQFLPFLFIPFLRLKELIPAVPFFIISFLSVNHLHSSLDSHYSVANIAPVFVSLTIALKGLNDRYGKNFTGSVLLFILIMVATFNIAHSPSPVSLNFLKQGWSDTWHRRNYIIGPHEETLSKAVAIIPKDGNVKVVCQNNAYGGDIANRDSLEVFPRMWQQAGYIILDLKRPLFLYDSVNNADYMREFEKLRQSENFRVVFEVDQVYVFMKNIGNSP
ncbi:MAG: DUF2079 domain-containing protein [Nitrospirae bacterium YQR-1]